MAARQIANSDLAHSTIERVDRQTDRQLARRSETKRILRASCAWAEIILDKTFVESSKR